MIEKIELKKEQIVVLSVILLLMEVMIRPFSAQSSNEASIVVLSTLINAFIIYLISYKILSCKAVVFNNEKFTFVSAVVAIVLLVNASSTLLSTELFYRFISDEQINIFLFAVIILGVCCYGIKIGLLPVARSSSIVLSLMLVSVFVVVLANASSFEIEKLKVAENILNKTLETTAKGAFISPEILIIYWLFDNSKAQNKTNILSVILATTALITIVLTVSGELLLGDFNVMLKQPLHVMAKIGSLSVFERLDSVHTTLWIMCSIVKITVNCLAIEAIIKPLFKKKYAEKLLFLVSALVFLLFCLFVSFSILSLKAYVSIATLVIVLLLTIQSISKERKKIL